MIIRYENLTLLGTTKYDRIEIHYRIIRTLKNSDDPISNCNMLSPWDDEMNRFIIPGMNTGS